MNARTLFNFFRSPPGLLLLFMAGVAGALFLFRSMGGGAHRQAQERPLRPNPPQTIERVQTGVGDANFPAMRMPTPSNQPGFGRQKKPPEMLTLCTTKVRTKRMSPLYAPYGRLVKCQLVVTVDSSSIETPIIGLVNRRREP